MVTVSDEEEPFSATERDQLAILNRALQSAYGAAGDREQHKTALRCYLQTMTMFEDRYRMFEITNHRIFSSEEGLVVPYNAHGRLTIYRLKDGSQQLVARLRLPHGTLVTDKLISELAGADCEPIDLEREIYHLEFEDMPEIQVNRLRDLAKVLRRLNTSGSRHEAVYLLRFLVARLCSASYKGMPGAKNLQTEITRVRKELIDFMNGPFADRIRLPSRILVRSISGLVSRPKLIDEVWQDTIDLAEVHVRGSAITNEIRRSTHHAMGKHTLALSRAYLQWLQTGEGEFPDPQREVPGPADHAARNNKEIKGLVGRIVENLEQLLDSSQLARRMVEWRDAYSEELLLCESGNSLEQELDSLVVNGIQARNRWV
jgi:hypothetical protein